MLDRCLVHHTDRGTGVDPWVVSAVRPTTSGQVVMDLITNHHNHLAGNVFQVTTRPD